MTAGGYDLHTHSVHSDGTTTPGLNAELAAEVGLAGFALTDHDTLDGWEEAAAACRRLGLEFVPGVELSTEDAGRSVHILGYWMNPDNRALRDECARLRFERERRAGAMVELLTANGVPVSLERVQAIAGTAPIGRPHIAAAMVEAGVVPDTQAAFDLWIGDDRPAYVVKHALDPEEGVRLICEAGGVAVLAHPGLPGDDVDVPFVQRLVAAGLAGLEVDHPSHDLVGAAFWRAVARETGLCATGSSDFHGERKSVSIGCSSTAAEVLRTLRDRVVTPTMASAAQEGDPPPAVV
jgi:3',5'-nucleoside bisphosphate phosphatase